MVLAEHLDRIASAFWMERLGRGVLALGIQVVGEVL